MVTLRLLITARSRTLSVAVYRSLFVVFLGLGCTSGCDSTADLSVSGASKNTKPQSKSREESPTDSVPEQSTSKAVKLAAESNKAVATREQAPALERVGAEIAYHSDGQISEIHLLEAEMTDALAEELTKLNKLLKLTIRQSSMTDAGWDRIGKCTQLRHLDLRECKLNNQQLASALSNLTKLASLRLNGQSGATTVDDTGLSALSGCPDLKVLALDHLWVGEQGLANLSQNKRLSELYMAGTIMDDTAMQRLASFPALQKLRLSQTSISTDGLTVLTTLPIEDLDISECSQLSDDAMRTIGKLSKLKRLNLFKTPITDEGIQNLANLKQLEWFNVDQTAVTDAALAYIGQMTALRFLHLGSTAVSDEGMPDLLPLKKLQNLIVTRTSVTENGVHIIKTWLPGVEVQLKYVAGE